MSFEEGPLYYREIQKNAYLKRVPNETTGSKFMQLAYKKVPLKPMWTLFCIHNGRTPYLEQYNEATSGHTMCHKPVWRACLVSARHVTGSVQPRAGGEHDFLVDTDHGSVRMVAADWDTMQDWVSTLRTKLQELRILSSCQNVYGAPPAPPAARAPARDPTSPLPPVPPVPPDRVPGIELIPPRVPPSDPPPNLPPSPPSPAPVDISNWEEDPQPSTSSSDHPQSVAKICGQNICLDDSILRRRDLDDDDEYKQTVKVEEGDGDECETKPQTTNITVIQVLNKQPPHTAIPVLGPERDIFNFDFKEKVNINDKVTIQPDNSFVNIVNTEDNGYGAVFNDGDYGHLSLTTTVNLTDATVNVTSATVNVTNSPIQTTVSVSDTTLADSNVNSNVDNQESVYERLSLASTSKDNAVTRVKNTEKVRKSSLPNLDTNDSTYEYLFPNNNGNVSTDQVNSRSDNSRSNQTSSRSDQLNSRSDNSRSNQTSSRSDQLNSRSDNVNSRSDQVNSINDQIVSRNDQINSRTDQSNSRKDQINSRIDQINSRVDQINSRSVQINSRSDQIVNERSNGNRQEPRPVNIFNNSLGDQSHRARANIERSQSQNACDASERLRERLLGQSRSPKRDGEKTEQLPAKPIWKRGLTEFSLLTKLRRAKRHDSPVRQEPEVDSSPVVSPVKVVRRSRPEGRIDGARRRSSSLNNGQSPRSPANLQPLRVRQALALQADQRRGALAVVASARDPPMFVDYDNQVWICHWGNSGRSVSGRAGDRVAAVNRQTPRNAAHATLLIKQDRTQRYITKYSVVNTMMDAYTKMTSSTLTGVSVDILFHRVPLAKIYVITRSDNESLGIKLDSECNIVSVDRNSTCARANFPPAGRWAVTEVNNRPIAILKGGEEEIQRALAHGSEVSILIQPSALVKRMRSALKANKYLLR